jgi:uncharacterized membrane protein
MAVINTGALAKSIYPGITEWFGRSYNEHGLQCRDIFGAPRSSERRYEESQMITGLGLASVLPEGSGVAYDSFSEGFNKTHQHVTYGLGFIITKEAIEDNQYMELALERTEVLARSMRETKEHVAANVLNRAFNSSYTGADGLELCSAVHLLQGGGTYQNELTTAADLSEASLEQAIIDLGDLKDDKSLRIAIKGRKLIVPTELQFEAERILKSTLQNDTANNAINALKGRGVLPEGYAVNNYLTDADAWFVITDCPKGLSHWERVGTTITNDSDFDTDNMKFKARERYIFDWTDPRGVYGSPGA